MREIKEEEYKKRMKRRRFDMLPRKWDNWGMYIGDSWKLWGNRLINIKGKRFWNLFVLRRDRTRSSRAYSYWICQCDCKRRYSIRSDRLRKGEVTCCIECARKVNALYKKIRDDKRTEEQLRRAAIRRVQIIKVDMDEFSVKASGKEMFDRSEIKKMRNDYNMQLKEIAEWFGISTDEVRNAIAGKPLAPPERKEETGKPRRVFRAAPLEVPEGVRIKTYKL